ncbi:hypothetical protein CPB86DRAFT_784866, partial [Serendipita vermifera]
MAEQGESVIQRTPQEIWWNILDETIDMDLPSTLATTYEGNYWPEDSGLYMTDEGVRKSLYKNSENQRKIIGSVCRSWQVFAQTRRNRRIFMSYVESNWPLEMRRAFVKARSVHLWPHVLGGITELFPDITKTVDWEILATNRQDALKFAREFSHPRVRHLELLDHSWSDPLNMELFLDVLSAFPDLTWLSYHFQDINDDLRIQVAEDRPPLVLAKLQTLWYRGEWGFAFPFTHLVFPSLQYLSVHFDAPLSEVSLLDLLSGCRQAIRSVVISSHVKGNEIVETHFPPWKKFPNLEELVLDSRWAIQFEELSPGHPLKRLEAQQASPDPIPSFIESMNMQTLVLQGSKWTERGELQGRHGGWTMDLEKSDQLLRVAMERGMRFQITLDGSEFLSRDRVVVTSSKGL